MNIWDVAFVNPLINALIILSNILFSNFGLGIIVFTLLMRLATMPLTLRQIHSTRAMSMLQPKMQEIQKKYKDPKRRQEETMKLYRQAGVNPLGCLLPMLVQMPIWFALYGALRITVGGTPESVVSLSERLYSWGYIESAVPLENRFLWLDLGQPDRSLILALLVFASTYVQQKLSTVPSTDPQKQAQAQMMNWMMPLMFAWFTLGVPSGLAVYWAMSNITAVIMYYFVYGPKNVSWRTFFPAQAPAPAARRRDRREAAPEEEKDEEPAAPAPAKTSKRLSDGRRRGKRKNRR
ncbi:MAG TPA: YidC/Oxa1 family membrane protein insertase [Dehalococcoidia bacterium]|nr:YidC/Oxa1 family membrane protein insertase [Dehalococcoidia bacterium]